MEYALTADHHRVHAFDAEKGQEYYCPVCGNQVIPRQGEVNSWHFAHVTSCMDDWKYDMSEWHRGWQSRFPENVREIVVEHRGECHRADILMGGYVIEFQHSPISAGEFELRTKFYTRAGYRPVVPAGPTQEDLDAEYIRICQSYDPTSDEWTVDRYNRRWIMCTVCGRIKQDAQMSYYGGKGGANRGVCADCSRNGRS